MVTYYVGSTVRAVAAVVSAAAETEHVITAATQGAREEEDSEYSHTRM